MAATLFRIATISVITLPLLPYVMRFDLALLGRLSLRGPQRYRLLWPLTSWLRALAKPSATTVGGSRVLALVAGVVLVVAGGLVLGVPAVEPIWPLALLVGARLALAGAAPERLPCGPLRSRLWRDGLGATVVLALALTGPAVLSRQSLTPIAGWLVLYQPLALVVGSLAVSADPFPSGEGDRRAGWHFQLLHGGGLLALLETSRYAWWFAGSALLVTQFAPAVSWPWQLALVVVWMVAVLGLRHAYTESLYRRLDWRFWPLLTILAAGSLAVTLMMWLS